MYPYLRLTRTLLKSRFKSPLKITDVSVLPMRVCIVDIDPFWELNNGRHLTMMDFGRFEMALRLGLLKVVKEKHWGLAVAGSSVRYRHRLKLFQRYDLITQIVGADDKWIYFHQQTLRKGKIHSAALIRTGVTSKNGLVKTSEVMKALNIDIALTALPEWVTAWSEADELRPWNPILTNP
ncbi:MAG: thioesterase family protein [Bacteroidales bacterium]|nr:thioesterase family protein [Bacteroidales bacterium]